MKSSKSPTDFEQNNYDVTSIPGFVITKKSSRGPKHGVSERQVMFCKAKQMLKKAKQGKHGNDPTILSRWVRTRRIPKSHWRSTILAKRKSCFSIASLLKDTTFQIREVNGWILHLNADGPQKPLRQRPSFAVALKQCLQVQDAHLAETQKYLRPIRPEHQQRQRQDQQFEGGENFDYYVDRKTGWRYYREPR